MGLRLGGPLDGMKSTRLVGPIAKGLARRMSAAAECDAGLGRVDRKGISLRIEQYEGTFHQERSIVADTNLGRGHGLAVSVRVSVESLRAGGRRLKDQ